MQRHMNRKHSNSNFAPVVPMPQEKWHRFQLVHPFTCMVAGMTGSGKTVWVQSLLQQSQTVIDQPPERIIWCYLQWQNAYTQLLMMIPTTEFVKGIPESLENDSYLDVNILNLSVIDDQMIEAGKDNRIVNLFKKGSHHRNASVIYIVQNLFHQGKENRSISLKTLKSHNLVFCKTPRTHIYKGGFGAPAGWQTSPSGTQTPAPKRPLIYVCKIIRPAALELFFILKKCSGNVLWEEEEKGRWNKAKGEKKHQEV